ncbi:MAG: LemA family protein [Planctomycetes bacterium]|nr:LemA family protein [Planctomycetota bacterium]
MNPLIITLVVIVLLIVIVAGMYNGLIALRNRVKNAFAQIDVQLKRRYDLIPNLVETAKTYMAHERQTLEAVITARNEASSASSKVSGNPADPESMKALMGAESALGGAMGRFFALSEAYPDLKANQNMMQLTEELTSTENKIAFSRQSFNDSVMAFNTKLESFPTNILASMFNFKQAESFEVSDRAERESVKVKF